MEYDYDFSDVTGCTRVYPVVPKPYTHWRIKRILRDYYALELENIFQGYKANRRYGYCRLYRVLDIETKEVFIECISMDGLRQILTEQGFPLKESSYNPYAEYFMEILTDLRRQAKNQN